MGRKDKMLKGIGARVKGFPYHTRSSEDRPAYHNRSDCIDGREIEDKNIRSGKAGRPLCKQCAGLQRGATR
jgi:hypothetical protein